MKKRLSYLSVFLFAFILLNLFLFSAIDVSALGFNSTSVRIASWYENGQLADTGFISTNPRPLPQYVSNEIGPVSLRLIQWRYTTSSPLAVGRYKITTDISFSSLDGNKIDNFLSINKFDEYGCGTAYNNSTADNMTLISHDLTRLSDTSYRFEYVFDLKSATCNFFSGIIKYGENEYTEKYVINQYSTNNESLSYSVSYSSVEVLNNQEIIDNQDKNTQDVIDNNNQNTQDIIDNQNKNNEELKDTINDNLSTCGPGKNLFDKSKITSNSYINSNGVISSNNTYSLSDFISVISGVLYSYQGISSYIYGAYYDSNYNFIERFPTYPGKQSITIPNNVSYVRFIIPNTDINVFQFEKGPATDYEEYNPKGTCVPVLDETNDKLDEAEKTRKGIWETIKSIPNILIDGIKGLFVPDSEEMNNLITDLQSTMEEKLGVIYESGSILTGLFQAIVDTNSDTNACISLPEIVDPVFDKKIMDNQDYCFEELEAQIPLLFIILRSITGIIITLTFINMLHKKLNGILGGDSRDY